MHPKLFEIGPLTVWSFGAMMAIAFITTSFLYQRELARRGVTGDLSSWITIAAIAGGVIGAKLMWAVEHFSSFLSDPLGAIFSGSGLTWYGGLILASAVIILIIKLSGNRFWWVADPVGPLVSLGYGIGRIGCFLSGDGDYGPPSNLPWAMPFPDGTLPPHRNPAIQKILGTTDVSPYIRVHPTPLYEFLICLGIFLYLWRMRKKTENMPGYLFGLALILCGLERFITEFWRLNPKTVLGMSTPQAMSLVSIAVGITLIWFGRTHRYRSPEPVSPPKESRKRRK